MEIRYPYHIRVLTRYFLILLLYAGMILPGHAQDDPTNRHYLFNLLNINPAYAGSRGTLSLTAGFNRQWIGVPGAPTTAMFSMDAPVNAHHLGLGLHLYNNSVGMERTTGANMSFATLLNFAEDEFLSLGLQGGLMNYRIDRTSVALPFQNDPAFQNNTNVIMPTAGVGVYYQRPGFYASLSAPSLLLSTVKVDKILSVNSATLKNVQLILTTGITAQLGDVLEYKPSLFFKWMNGKVFDVHVNSSFWLGNIVGIGASYRLDDAILGILELRISDKLNFGYSYGRNIGDKVYFTQATHEAMIRLNLGGSE
jgi:type IX secretion system PorP/SprF family membrane protein